MSKEKSVFLVDTGAVLRVPWFSGQGLTSFSGDNNLSAYYGTRRSRSSVELGGVLTQWKFLVVDNLRESVLGADFIESHHESSWGIRDGALWLDDWKIPLVDHRKCGHVLIENYSPVITRCTVELPARHQVLIPTKTKYGDSRTGLFESTRTPSGVLLSKTVVDGDKDG